MGFRWEKRRVTDPAIIGKDVYHVENETLIGRLHFAARHTNGLAVCLVQVAGVDHYVRVWLNEVLIKVSTPDSEPDTVELPPPDQLPPLPQRTHRGYPVTPPEREKKLGEATGEDHREPGVSDGEAALPREDEPDPEPLDRPGGKHHHPGATLYPEGKPLGRKKEDPETRQQGGSHTQGGSTMASVSEVRAAIDQALNLADEAAEATRVAINKLDESTSALAAALEGAGHESTAQAHAALAHAKQQLEEGIQAIAGGKELAQNYGAGL